MVVWVQGPVEMQLVLPSLRRNSYSGSAKLASQARNFGSKIWERP